MIGIRTLMKRVSVILPFVIAAAFLISSQATAREFSQQKVVNFDWKQFGKKVIDRADYSTKKKIMNSTEERARYIAQEVGRQLNAMRVMPNTSMLSRGMSWKRYGDQAVGTCEHVTESLKDAMSGGGIDERRLLRIFGEKSAVRSANPFDVNRNHMALALIGDNGELISYDLWMHGGEHGTFAKFDESIWNGQSAENWSEIMQKNGYLKQACEDCPDRSLKAPYQMVETLKDQANLVMRIMNAVPHGAVRVIVVDSRTGTGLQNVSVTVDGAVNSPVERIRLASSTDASGIVTLKGIVQGPYTVIARRQSCTPFESGLVNLKPRSSFNVRMQCAQEPQNPEARAGDEKKSEINTKTPAPSFAKNEQTEDQIVAEYRSLLPASLAANKKPWHTRFEIISNAVKVKPGEYRVNYKTYCIIEQGPDKGKDHACFENDSVLNLGQIKSAVGEMRRRLGR